jgi:hypothetical protein
MIKPLLELAVCEFSLPQPFPGLVAYPFPLKTKISRYPNFHQISTKKPGDQNALRLQPLFTALDIDSEMRGCISHLQIDVPALITHPYWNPSMNERFDWDAQDNKVRVVIEVTRWGPDQVAATQAAIYRAKSIICSIRLRIQASSRILILREPRLWRLDAELKNKPKQDPLVPKVYPVFEAGRKLSNYWSRLVLDQSKFVSSEAYIKGKLLVAKIKLQDEILKDYYEVLFFVVDTILII